jgi:hypothetical protein
MIRPIFVIIKGPFLLWLTPFLLWFAPFLLWLTPFLLYLEPENPVVPRVQRLRKQDKTREKQDKTIYCKTHKRNVCVLIYTKKILFC